MFPVTDTFLEALRSSHTVAVRVDAYSGSRLLASDIPVSDGSVSVSAGTGVHRKLSLTVPDPSLWDLLSGTGVELKAYRGIRYPGGAEEMVPLGVFSLDSQSTPVVAGGAISIDSAPDRWAAVQRARFELPRASTPGLTNLAQAIRLVTEVVKTTAETGRVTTSNMLSASKITKAVLWDRDRDKAVADLATAAGVEIYFGPLGNLIAADVPVRQARPVWRVTTGRDGVMLGGTATRDRSRVYNVVVVLSTKTDGTPPFAPQIVADTDPTSPTNVAGTYGRVPYFYSTGLIGSAAEARALGRNILSRTRARFIDMTCEAMVNPALESGDTIAVTGLNGRESLFVVDSFSVPLSVEGNQSLTLRSLAAVTNDSDSTATT